MELQDYDFDIEYRSGTKMAHVDCLSRNPAQDFSVNIINITEADWLQAVQLQDEGLVQIKTILEANEKNSYTKEYFDNYAVRINKIHRRVGNSLKWVVPRANRWQICKLCHDDIGHFEFEKTLAKIKENYWFAGMLKIVKKYVESCLNCLYYKTPSGRKPGELHPIEKVTIPFHTIQVDHLGLFIKTKKENTQLLFIVDGFTKFVILEPLRSTTA